MLSRIKGVIFELVHREPVHKPIKGYADLRYGVLDFLQCVSCGNRETESLYERRFTPSLWWERRGKLPPHEETWVLDAPDIKRVDGGAGQG